MEAIYHIPERTTKRGYIITHAIAIHRMAVDGTLLLVDQNTGQEINMCVNDFMDVADRLRENERSKNNEHG